MSPCRQRLPAAITLAIVAAVAAESPRAAERALPDLSLAYVLQAERLAGTRAGAVQKLAQCGRGLVVLDAYFDGSPWTRAEIDAIRAGMPGRGVVAYLSIGEAEDYRPYWSKAWDANRDGRPDPGAPAYLLGVNPDWPGNYRVRYWDSAWQTNVLRELDGILARGFDGAYLDIVDGFETFEYDPARKDWIDNRPNPATGRTFRQDMIAWVLRFAGHARAKSPGFLVIPQNGAQLLADRGYLAAIDAIGVEDLFTDGNRKQDREETAERLRDLQAATAAGKPVLVIEYGTAAAARKTSRDGAARSGFRLLLTDRDLSTLGQADGAGN